jgi:hypothetical protein
LEFMNFLKNPKFCEVSNRRCIGYQ